MLKEMQDKRWTHKLHRKKNSIEVIDNNKIHERYYVKDAMITENDITDLQNKLLASNFHEKELFYAKYYSQIVHRSKTYLKDLTENTSKAILMKLTDVI